MHLAADRPLRITTLAGGIGAAKFLAGLTEVTRPETVTVIANTGDDIELFGLRVSPDLDTLTYTLAGVINPQTGWGVRDDQFTCLELLGRYGGPAWFNLGDRDLATHIYRTHKLREGCSLSKVTEHICKSLGVGVHILPMTDSYVPTWVDTDEGEMHLQEYFVRRRCEPRVRAVRYPDAESVSPAPGVVDALLSADVVIFCPSNPFISIGPILAIQGIRDALERTRAAVAAITPIVGGRALKGPAADMLRDLGHEVSAAGVAQFYKGVIDLFVLDERDSSLRAKIEDLGIKVVTSDTIMATSDDKRRLASHLLAYIRREMVSMAWSAPESRARTGRINPTGDKDSALGRK